MQVCELMTLRRRANRSDGAGCGLRLGDRQGHRERRSAGRALGLGAAAAAPPASAPPAAAARPAPATPPARAALRLGGRGAVRRRVGVGGSAALAAAAKLPPRRAQHVSAAGAGDVHSLGAAVLGRVVGVLDRLALMEL